MGKTSKKSKGKGKSGKSSKSKRGKGLWQDIKKKVITPVGSWLKNNHVLSNVAKVGAIPAALFNPGAGAALGAAGGLLAQKGWGIDLAGYGYKIPKKRGKGMRKPLTQGGVRVVGGYGWPRGSMIGTMREVWNGTKHHTKGGLSKDKLMLNKRGKPVSILKHQQGVAMFKKRGLRATPGRFGAFRQG